MSKASEATRFPVNRRDHTKKGPYLTPILKKFLKKKINYVSPETGRKTKGRVYDALLWRLILNGAEGETQSIKEILERIDGKVKDKIETEISFKQMGNVKIDGKDLHIKIK